LILLASLDLLIIVIYLTRRRHAAGGGALHPLMRVAAFDGVSLQFQPSNSNFSSSILYYCGASTICWTSWY